uniref:Uncharacterized protein n=1 Tax=Fagus sylvatica TaxID=28930 RepID=A0A2N9GHY3_FAGSY
MQHIAGKLSTSSFQRYKVYMNRSSDERVMAPGSRGIGAVFVHLSGEDSDQMGDAFGEPRVPRRSWSRYLSNAPGLVDQLVASRKDSAREGGYFRRSWYRRKACVAYFCKVPDSRKSELGLVRYGSATRGHRSVFGPFEGSFPIRIPARPDKSWRSESSTSCMSVSSFQRTRACGSTCCESGRLCAQAWQRRYRPCTEASLGSQDMILRTEAVRNVPYAKGFDHNFLVSRPFWARKVSNRSSHYVLQNGQGSGQFDSVFGLVKVRSNLGQTWSTLVEFGSPNSGNVNRVSRVFGPDGPQSGWERLGQTLVKLRSTLVKLGQLGQTLGNVSWTFSLGVFDATRLRWIIRAGSGSPRHACRHSRKSCGVQMDIPKVENDRTRCGEAIGGSKGPTPIDDQFSPIRPTDQKLDRTDHPLTKPIWEATFAQRFSPTRCNLVREPRPLGKRFTSATATFGSSKSFPVKPESHQKMTPYKEHSVRLHIARTSVQGLCRSTVGNASFPTIPRSSDPAWSYVYHAVKTGRRNKGLLKVPGFSPPTCARLALTRNKLICEPGHIGKKTHPCTTWNSRIAKNLSGPAGIPIGKLPSNGPKTPRQRKLSDGTKNVKIRHRELGQICARTGTRFEKKRAGSKTHFFSRTAAFARRVFPARNKLIREPGCVGKIMTPATTWNSRFADSIPRLIGRVHKNSSDTPTSGSHNSLTSKTAPENRIKKGTRTEIEEDSRSCWRGRIRLPRGSTTTRAGPSCAAHDGAARGVHGFL